MLSPLSLAQTTLGDRFNPQAKREVLAFGDAEVGAHLLLIPSFKHGEIERDDVGKIEHVLPVVGSVSLNLGQCQIVRVEDQESEMLKVAHEDLREAIFVRIRTRHEVKLVTVWTAEGRDPDGIPVRDRGSVTDSAALESAASPNAVDALSAFAQRVDREAQRRGFDQAPRRVVLGDGAAWIWNLADDLFPGARQIVDLFHAKQHLSDVGKAIYGAGTDLARQWARLRHDELDAGHLRALCQALHRQAPTHAEARRCWQYVTHHRARMRDPAFRAQSLADGAPVARAV